MWCFEHIASLSSFILRYPSYSSNFSSPNNLFMQYACLNSTNNTFRCIIISEQALCPYFYFIIDSWTNDLSLFTVQKYMQVAYKNMCIIWKAYITTFSLDDIYYANLILTIVDPR